MHIARVCSLLFLRAYRYVAGILLQDVVIILVLILIFSEASRGAIRGSAALRDWNAARYVVSSQGRIVDGTSAVTALASVRALGDPHSPAILVPTPRVLRTTVDAD